MIEGKNKYQSRRDFVRRAGKIAVIAPLAIIPAALSRKFRFQDMSGRLILSNALSAVSARPIVYLHLPHQNAFMHFRCAVIAIFAEVIRGRE